MIQSKFGRKDVEGVDKQDVVEKVEIKICKNSDDAKEVLTESDIRKFFQNFEVLQVSGSELIFSN